MSRKKRKAVQPLILNVRSLRVGERTYIRNSYPQGSGHPFCCGDGGLGCDCRGNAGESGNTGGGADGE